MTCGFACYLRICGALGGVELRERDTYLPGCLVFDPASTSIEKFFSPRKGEFTCLLLLKGSSGSGMLIIGCMFSFKCVLQHPCTRELL